MNAPYEDNGRPPVALENIREMLGGDPEREKELFQIFIESADECLEGMKNSRDPGGENNWRTQAHAFKGMSLNLGAGELGRLCAEAQKNPAAPREEKDRMLAEISAEYNKVKEFLQQQRQG